MRKFIKITATLLSILMLTVFVVGCASQNKEVVESDKLKTEKVVETPSFPLKLIDDAGREIEVQEEPEKIISLAPSNTEILFALGVGDKVVGVTDFCDYPEEAKSKDKVGGFSDPNIEKIIELKPDLVLATGMHGEVLKQLEDVNIVVFVIDSKNIKDVIESIETVGKLTGQIDVSKNLIADMNEKIDGVKAKVANLSDGQRPLVYYEVWNDPIMTVGPGTLIYEIIEMAGGKNIAADSKEEYPQLSVEVLIEKDPQIIIASKGSMGEPGAVKERKGWENISAVQDEKVYVVDENLLVRAGPRIIDGLMEVAKILHPELY